MAGIFSKHIRKKAQKGLKKGVTVVATLGSIGSMGVIAFAGAASAGLAVLPALGIAGLAGGVEGQVHKENNWHGQSALEYLGPNGLYKLTINKLYTVLPVEPKSQFLKDLNIQLDIVNQFEARIIAEQKRVWDNEIKAAEEERLLDKSGTGLISQQSKRRRKRRPIFRAQPLTPVEKEEKKEQKKRLRVLEEQFYYCVTSKNREGIYHATLDEEDEELQAIIVKFKEELPAEKTKIKILRASVLPIFIGSIGAGFVTAAAMHSALITLGAFFTLSAIAASANIWLFAAIACVGYFYSIFRTVSDMVVNPFLRNCYKELKHWVQPNPQQAWDLKNYGRLAAVIVVGTLIAGLCLVATAITAGRWWFLAKDGVNLIPTIRKATVALISLFTSINAISHLLYNVKNSLETLKSIFFASLPENPLTYLKRKISKVTEAEGVAETVRLVDPTRWLVQGILRVSKWVVFFGHLVAEAFMGVRDDGASIKNIVKLSVGTANNGVNDFSFVFPTKSAAHDHGHDGKHRDNASLVDGQIASEVEHDHAHEHQHADDECKHKHAHNHQHCSHGHDHGVNIIEVGVMVAISPLILVAATISYLTNPAAVTPWQNQNGGWNMWEALTSRALKFKDAVKKTCGIKDEPIKPIPSAGELSAEAKTLWVDHYCAKQFENCKQNAVEQPSTSSNKRIAEKLAQAPTNISTVLETSKLEISGLKQTAIAQLREEAQVLVDRNDGDNIIRMGQYSDNNMLTQQLGLFKDKEKAKRTTDKEKNKIEKFAGRLERLVAPSAVAVRQR